MAWKWLPWKFLVRRAARKHGFLDPLAFMARLRQFAQPSEVAEPIELLRAGALFHARGLLNTRVIQHNLDWVWPYWIEEQFDPHSDAFLPRAFSVTHVNLTHRNWTAVGRPDCSELPIVDPRGLVTPLLDGWSLDAWVLPADGAPLFPSRAEQASQALNPADGVSVESESRQEDSRLHQRAWVEPDGADGFQLRLRVTAYAPSGGHMALALRPYNPEGVSFIHELHLDENDTAWRVEGGQLVRFHEVPDRHLVSDYRHGDIAMHLAEAEPARQGRCQVGLATAAALFRLAPGESRALEVTVPLPGRRPVPTTHWSEALAGAAALDIPDSRDRFLYNAALRTLVLHTVDDVVPGPYTYKRFWFRDAAFIVSALLDAGLIDRARRSLALFTPRQNPATGYYHSQEGEWDSNGQVLWIMARFARLTGEALPPEWLRGLRRGARWVGRKRTHPDGGEPHAGLLPAGFSAEHFGPNDYYYWDDFWAIAGLRGMAPVFDAAGETDAGERARREAADLESTVRACLNRDAERLGRTAMPASPYRRLDAGAIGTLAAGYPLQLCAPQDRALMGTLDYLYRNTLVHGGFFQDMIHSGVNAYLTLHMAQVLMRAGDSRCFELMDAVADLASPTGQWPEAIHPRTRGGCMGDGQHVWAAAEWIAMVRNSFVREEGDGLVIAGGIPPRWLRAGQALRFGPTPTPYGPVRVTVTPEGGEAVRVDWSIEGDAPPAWLRIGGAGMPPVDVAPDASTARLRRTPSVP